MQNTIICSVIPQAKSLIGDLYSGHVLHQFCCLCIPNYGKLHTKDKSNSPKHKVPLHSCAGTDLGFLFSGWFVSSLGTSHSN